MTSEDICGLDIACDSEIRSLRSLSRYSGLNAATVYKEAKECGAILADLGLSSVIDTKRFEIYHERRTLNMSVFSSNVGLFMRADGRKKWTTRGLASDAGIEYQRLEDLLYHNSDPTLDEAERIAKVFNTETINLTRGAKIRPAKESKESEPITTAPPAPVDDIISIDPNAINNYKNFDIDTRRMVTKEIMTALVDMRTPGLGIKKLISLLNATDPSYYNWIAGTNAFDEKTIIDKIKYVGAIGVKPEEYKSLVEDWIRRGTAHSNLKNIISASGLSIREFGKQTGYNYTVLTKLLNGSAKFSDLYGNKITKALKIGDCEEFMSSVYDGRKCKSIVKSLLKNPRVTEDVATSEDTDKPAATQLDAIEPATIPSKSENITVSVTEDYMDGKFLKMVNQLTPEHKTAVMELTVKYFLMDL